MNSQWPPIPAPLIETRHRPGRAVHSFLTKWLRTILTVGAGVAAGVAALAYVIPPTYEAETAILVERNRAPVMRADYAPGLEMAEAMNTARAVASARSVMAATVDSLGLADRKQPETAVHRLRRDVAELLIALGLWPRLDARDAWIESLMKTVDIRPTVSSNILNIAYAHEDRDLAAAVVNTVAEKYIDLHIKIYSTGGLAEFYKKHAEEAELKYKQLRDQLLAFKAEANFAAAEVTKSESARELSTLRTQLLASSAEMARLLKRYEPQHAEVTLQRNSIAATESQIRDIEARLQGLERDSAVNADLEMLLDAQRKALLDYTNKHREAALSQRADREVVNVHIVGKAVTPIRPRFSRLFIILVGCLAGILVGIVVAFVRDYLDGRCTTPEQVEAALGLPVIGGLDRLSARRLHAMMTTVEPRSPTA